MGVPPGDAAVAAGPVAAGAASASLKLLCNPRSFDRSYKFLVFKELILKLVCLLDIVARLFGFTRLHNYLLQRLPSLCPARLLLMLLSLKCKMSFSP